MEESLLQILLILLLVKHIFSYSLSLSPVPACPWLFFTIATRLPSSQTLPNLLLTLTHKFSLPYFSLWNATFYKILVDALIRNCWCATLFESQANEGNKGNAAFLFFRGKDSERTSKRSNNKTFYVKIKFVPRRQGDFKGKCQMSPWIRRIANNKCFFFIKRAEFSTGC